MSRPPPGGPFSEAGRGREIVSKLAKEASSERVRRGPPHPKRRHAACLVHAMNYYFFALKRSYHSVLRITRDVAAAYGLTPARADMLYAIFRVPTARCFGPRGRGTLTQRELRTMLGVSAPTVSRMVRALEDLGFVTRRPSSPDRRTFDITLTDFGWGRVRAMFHEVFKWNLFGLVLDCVFASPVPHANERATDERLAELFDLTGRIRYGLRDRATLEYPYFDPESW